MTEMNDKNRGEPILTPDLPIIDAHHHLWATPPAPFFPSYDEDDVLADKTGSGHNVVATIYVEAQSHYRTEGPEHLRLVGETEYIEKFGRSADALGGKAAGACSGIVAKADLLMGSAVAEILAAHRAAAPDRLVGIRHRVSYDPDVPQHSGSPSGEAMLPAFREGFAELGKAGLCFEAAFFQSQLGELFDLASAFPDSRIVINHAGYPIGVGRYAMARDEGFRDWREKMRTLAQLDNVFVKIGGLNMEFTGLAAPDVMLPCTSDQVAELQRDHVLTTIDLFGPERCMFESNFPVDLPRIPYSVLWNSFKKIVQDFSLEDRERLFAGTACAVYGLRLPYALGFAQELCPTPHSIGRQ